jgi:general secretion pathway protein G
MVVAGTVAMLAIPRSIFYFRPSPAGRAKTDIYTITQSLTEYAINNNGNFPRSLVPLVTPDANGHCYLEGYNQRIPRDPWKREYVYEPPTPEHPGPHVYSLGADGKRGGSGDDADIDSDQLTEEPR